MNLNLATPFRGNLFHNDEATSMAAQMSCQLMPAHEHGSSDV